MAHSIISDEINAGTLKYSSWASLNVNKYQQMYSISSIEEHVIRCKYLICHFKGGIPLAVFSEIMSCNICRKLFSSKLTTILVGYPLTFLQVFRKIVTLKGVSHYELLENHFL